MKEDNKNKVEEPVVAYQPSTKKTITFFNNFEEMEEHGLKTLASFSHLQNIQRYTKMRKIRFHHLLLPDGSLPPLAKTISVLKLSL